jgi:hypothetical protein
MIRRAALSLLFFSFASHCYAVSLSVDLSTDRLIYHAKEPVKIALTVTNNGSADADLLFGSGQSYDIMITDKSGHDIWHWSYNKVFTMAVRNVDLPPGQGLKYAFIWKQTDNKKLPVKRGKYFIQGRLMSAEQLNSPRKTIIIK